ncbi:MAG: copper chaperone PCu(A)C [Sphingobacteriia bacterium]|nr:copper chaperone PCu(A)C [Sphingobacteriia bacterium]
MKKSLLPILLYSAIANASVPSQAPAPIEKPKLCTVQVTDQYVKATLEGSKSTAAYMKILNPCENDISINLITSDIPAVIEIHDMKHENNIMKMFKIRSLNIPSKGTVELKPGGKHIMFLDLKKSLIAGESHMLTLVQNDNQGLNIKIPVK